MRQGHFLRAVGEGRISVLLGSEDEGLIGRAPFLVGAPETLLRLR